MITILVLFMYIYNINISTLIGGLVRLCSFFVVPGNFDFSDQMTKWLIVNPALNKSKQNNSSLD